MYTNNTFKLAGLTEYSCFTRLLSRQNLDLIQSLHVQWSYEAAECERDFLVGVPPYHVGFWAETWNAISGWKGLRHVRVDMHKWRTGPRLMAYQEEHYFAPLMVLGKQIHLEVCVTWERLGTGRYAVPPDEEKWPFLIKRNMRYCENGDSFRLEARD